MTDEDGEPRVNFLQGMLVMMFAMVFHLWMDMMGDFEAGGRIAAILMIAGLVLYMEPMLEDAFLQIKEYYKS